MEANETQSGGEDFCSICGNKDITHLHRISDNFVKFKGSFVPFAEIVFKTLNFEVSRITILAGLVELKL